jgi:hypothetical protein
MPSVGAIIGGTVTVLLGGFIFSYCRNFGDYFEYTTFRWPWEKGRGKFEAFFIGLILMYFGLYTALNLNVLSILMLIPTIPIIWHYNWVGHVLTVFFSRREPSESKIKTGKYILLTLAVAWSSFAVYLSVKDWF